MKSTYEKRWGHPRTRKATIKRTMKAQRRTEAHDRNERWNGLSQIEQIAILRFRPGKCAKQIARINANN